MGYGIEPGRGSHAGEVVDYQYFPAAVISIFRHSGTQYFRWETLAPVVVSHNLETVEMSLPDICLICPESVIALYRLDFPSLVKAAVVHSGVEDVAFRHCGRLKPVLCGAPSQNGFFAVPDDDREGIDR